jgi:hypothetical protein
VPPTTAGLRNAVSTYTLDITELRCHACCCMHNVHPRSTTHMAQQLQDPTTISCSLNQSVVLLRGYVRRLRSDNLLPVPVSACVCHSLVQPLAAWAWVALAVPPLIIFIILVLLIHLHITTVSAHIANKHQVRCNYIRQPTCLAGTHTLLLQPHEHTTEQQPNFTIPMTSTQHRSLTRTVGRDRFCCPPPAAPGRFCPAASALALPETTS